MLAQIRPAEASKGSSRGSILISAEDMFFSPMPEKNTLQLINYMNNHLPAYYKQEEAPMQTKMAGRLFTFFAYGAPVAQLHWYVMATQIRCHVVEILRTSRDTKLLGNLVLDLNKMKLPAGAGPADGMGGGPFPVCMKDYARDANLITRVDPVFTEHRVNPVPVRIIIDTKGRVKHIHFLSALPDQARAVTDALRQWKFKPYLEGGRPVEVERG